MPARRLKSAITLLELLVALALLAVVVLSFTGIDIFSHHQVISSDRRSKLQNETSYVLEHMTKEVAKAIGNERINGQNTVVNAENIGSMPALRVYIDSGATTGVPGDGIRDLLNDRWVGYRYTGNTGDAAKYQIQYCSDMPGTTIAGTTCDAAGGWEILSRHARDFSITKPMVGGTDSDPQALRESWIEVALTSCWAPATATLPEGNADNPCVTMRTQVKIPLVSTN